MKKITLLMCLLQFSILTTLAQDPRNRTFFLSSGLVDLDYPNTQPLPWELQSECYPYNSIYNFSYWPDQYNGFVSVCDENRENRTPILVTDGTHVWFYSHDHYELISSELKAGFQNEAYLQNTIIIPKPGWDRYYYIVTLSGDDLGTGAGFGHNQGMYYSEVDAYYGRIIQLNIPLYPNISGEYYAGPNRANALTSTLHSDGYNYWLIASSDYGVANVLSSYLVTDQGIEQVSNFDLPIEGTNRAMSLKITKEEIAPNQRRIACGSLNGNTFLGTFNCGTGEITQIPDTNLPQARSVEFSTKNGKYLYCLTSEGEIYRITINEYGIYVLDYPTFSHPAFKSLQYFEDYDQILISRSPNYGGNYLSAMSNSDYFDISPGIYHYPINMWNTTAVPQTVVFQECNFFYPTFNIPNYSVCQGSTINPLPTTSTNWISGIWSPAFNNMATTTYTFTPYPGQCAVEVNMTITVKPTPVFNETAMINNGTINYTLPTTSVNGIVGTWNPGVVSEGERVHTFTPNTGQCPITKSFLVMKQTTIDAVDDDFSYSPIIDGVGFDSNGDYHTPSVFDNDSIIFENTVSAYNANVSIVSVNPPLNPNYYYPFVMTADGKIKVHRGTPYGTYSVVYKITQNSCPEKYDTATATVYIPDPNANSRKAAKTKQLSSNITVYPNPSKDIFNFDLTNIKEEYDTVTVYNILGAKVYENSLRANSFNLINLSDLTTGCYIAKVSGSSGVASFQLIKQ
ncbi:MAG: T9SS type A sorting domain-containing protein [Flavobacterium sp.]